MKKKKISNAEIFVQDASEGVYLELELPINKTKLFTISINGVKLRTPKGNIIASDNAAAMRELSAELDFTDELDVTKISLYNLLCTQIDFPIHLKSSFDMERVKLLLLSDPILTVNPGPEGVEMLKYMHPVEAYLEGNGLKYPLLPVIPIPDLSLLSEESKKNFMSLMDYTATRIHAFSEVERAIFITVLTVWDSTILPLLIIDNIISAQEFATICMASKDMNSKVYSFGDRNEEIEVKRELTRDAECIMRYRNLFSTRKSETEIIIEYGESKNLEFKSTLRFNLYTKEHDSKMEHSVLKTVVAFLNTEGGTLLIGVSDSGDYIGMDIDGFESEDKYQLHFRNLLKTKIGLSFMDYISWQVVPFKNGHILKVDCRRSKRPVFLKTDQGDKFYIRSGPATDELAAQDLIEYTGSHFKS